MKKVMNQSTAIAIALFVILTIAFAVPVLANEGKNEDKKNPGVELKFIGNYENQPVFQLNLVSAVEDEFTIVLRDKDGNVLYADKVKGTNITKKFLLSTEELGDNLVTVEVKSKKNQKPEVYTINRKQNLVEETLVTKLK
ncbi:MAG: hypothetical protein P0Y53_00580 [Candidatus Pseudobacter hemicellulosilyticus]|uniref:Uncharacterized protein n=1 Tax=Candidatus Pseudobacter hemicellulosilyticus TaxID=3121375 RepID=A0AAJ5WSJ0_9BACT|nr:MAG: hypothetical protein P0Y53_00580 [Pseudobacter sp.]